MTPMVAVANAASRAGTRISSWKKSRPQRHSCFLSGSVALTRTHRHFVAGHRVTVGRATGIAGTAHAESMAARPEAARLWGAKG